MMLIEAHDGNQLFVKTYGSNTNKSIIFSNSLGADHSMWQAQIEALSERYHIITYDTRGHGQSTDKYGPWTIADLGKDVISILNYLRVPKTIFCGLSMGGITGLWLALHYPQLFERFFICNTSALVGIPENWLNRKNKVLEDGLTDIAKTAGERWFTSTFLNANPEVMPNLAKKMLAGSSQGYANCCDILAKTDLRQEISRISSNITIIAGELDQVTTVKDAQYMHSQIINSNLIILPCSHISNIEQADRFNTLF